MTSLFGRARETVGTTGRQTMPLAQLDAFVVIGGAPVVIYFWFILHFGVNVPFQDSWNGTIPVVRAFANGNLTFALLWAPHNENRMLVPDLIQAALDVATHMNEIVDMVVSASMLVAAVGLFTWLAHRSLSLPWIWLIPLPWILLSLVQVENTLWAFQLAWMLILFLTAAALTAIELAPNSRAGLALAVGCGVLASFSSLQGLVIWPVGLVYGVSRGWSRSRWITWACVGAVSTAAYAWQIGPVQPPPHPGYALTHPVLSVHFFIELVGGMFVAHHGLLGAATLLVLVGAAAISYRDSRWWVRLRVPLALILSGLLFDVLVTEGRVPLGLLGATASRYTTYNLLLLAGIYLAAVAAARAVHSDPGSAVRFATLPMRRIVLCAAGLVVLVQLAWGFPYGLYQGQVYFVNRSIGAHLLLNYRHESASELGLYLFYPEGAYVKAWAPVLARHHWSVFSN